MIEGYLVGDRAYFGLPPDDTTCFCLPKGLPWCRKYGIPITSENNCQNCEYNKDNCEFLINTNKPKEIEQ